MLNIKKTKYFLLIKIKMILWNPFQDKMKECIFENEVYEKKKNIYIIGSFIIFLLIIILVLILVF